MPVAQSGREQGFTIVEVLIVLGIAGLILTITFLALPNLIRNQHNNERRHDVDSVLSAVSHYELNNSGAMPDYCDGLGPNCGTTFLTSSTYKLSYYTKSQIGFYPEDTYGHSVNDGTTPTDVGSVNDSPSTTPATIMSRFNSSNTSIMVYNYLRCDQDGTVATRASSGYRDVAAIYAIETADTTATECQQL